MYWNDGTIETPLQLSLFNLDNLIMEFEKFIALLFAKNSSLSINNYYAIVDVIKSADDGSKICVLNRVKTMKEYQLPRTLYARQSFLG
jgi:hypothetical protein